MPPDIANVDIVPATDVDGFCTYRDFGCGSAFVAPARVSVMLFIEAIVARGTDAGHPSFHCRCLGCPSVAVSWLELDRCMR